jgi:AcrR family transcriptional regulator
MAKGIAAEVKVPETGRVRGRRRDPRIDAQVLQAAVQELAERGIAGFSVNSVAARAEVDKRGIYARWPERDHLIVDALGTLAAGLVPPRTGVLRTDLLALAPAVAAVFTSPRREILERGIAEARDYPGIYAGFRRDSVDRCAAVVEDAFRSAQQRGESDPAADASQAADAFLGMFLARATLLGEGAVLDERAQDAVIEFCLRAVALPATTGRGDGRG